MSAETVLDAIAPKFAADPNKSTFLALAAGRTSTTRFGSSYELAVAYRAAHMMTLSGRDNGEAGAIESKREGDLAVAYDSGGDSGRTSDDLSQTHYGRQLKQLMRGVIVGVRVTGRGV